MQRRLSRIYRDRFVKAVPMHLGLVGRSPIGLIPNIGRILRQNVRIAIFRAGTAGQKVLTCFRMNS